MRYFTYTIPAILICLAANLGTNLMAQDNAEGGPSAMMEIMMMPGPEHELLTNFTGNWSTSFTYREQPGTDGMKVSCNDHAESIYGGKYVKYTSKITEGPITGESTEYWGYDRRIGKYTYFRMDSNSNSWMTATGTYDKSKNAIMMEGTDFMPGPDGSFQPMPFKMELKLDGKNKCMFKVDIPDGNGGMFTMVEGTSTRK